VSRQHGRDPQDPDRHRPQEAGPRHGHGLEQGQGKAGERGGQRKQRTAPTPAAHREWVDKTNAKLAAIDAAAWTEEEKIAFATALGELKKTILALLKTKMVTLA